MYFIKFSLKLVTLGPQTTLSESLFLMCPKRFQCEEFLEFWNHQSFIKAKVKGRFLCQENKNIFASFQFSQHYVPSLQYEACFPKLSQCTQRNIHWFAATSTFFCHYLVDLKEKPESVYPDVFYLVISRCIQTTRYQSRSKF